MPALRGWHIRPSLRFYCPSGRMRFVYRHFPARLSITTIFLIGAELGFPETAIRNALETGQYRNKVRSDFMGGVRSGVNGTPAFFINGVRHDGPYDYASLVSALQMQSAVDTGT